VGQGDYVFDTPAERSANFGDCPASNSVFFRLGCII